jgi:hypothetical protein
MASSPHPCFRLASPVLFPFPAFPATVAARLSPRAPAAHKFQTRNSRRPRCGRAVRESGHAAILKIERTNPLSTVESARIFNHPVIYLKPGNLSGLSRYVSDSNGIDLQIGGGSTGRDAQFRAKTSTFGRQSASSARSCRRPAPASPRLFSGRGSRRHGTHVGPDSPNSRLRAPLRKDGGNGDFRSSIFVCRLNESEATLEAKSSPCKLASGGPRTRETTPPTPHPPPPLLARNEANRSFRINRAMPKNAQNEAKRSQIRQQGAATKSFKVSKPISALLERSQPKPIKTGFRLAVTRSAIRFTLGHSSLGSAWMLTLEICGKAWRKRSSRSSVMS